MKLLTTSLLSVVAAVFFMTSCVKETVKGTGSTVEKEISISDYDKILLTGKIDMEYEYKPGQPAYLRIVIDENLYPLLKIKTEGGKLSFDSDSNLDPTVFKVYTNSSSLKEVESAGKGNILLKGNVTGARLDVNIKGNADLIAEDLKYDELNINVAGSSNVQLKGLVGTTEYNIKGLGTVSAYDLISTKVKCDVTGKGNLQVFASQELDINIKGNAEITYTGNPPIIKQEIFGNGKVSMKE